MRNTLTLMALVAVALLSVACGAPAATSAPPATSAPTATSTSPATPSPAAASPTLEPVHTTPVQATQPPTGGEGTTVEITLADNTIASPLASFQAGIPYTFVIENTGPHAHDFNINPPAEQTGGLDAARDQALLAVEQSELSPGATVTVTYTFPASAIGATLELSCLIRNHYLDGMRLPITVTP